MVARTPLARVRGLGAAGSGTREYWLIKLTSVALLPLTIAIVVLAVLYKDAGHAEVKNALSAPYIALPLVLFVVATAVHMRHGMQNVIDDYGHGKVLKKIVVSLNIFFCYGTAAAAIYFILILGLGGLS